MANKKAQKTVTSTWLNLREEPEGKIIKVMESGEFVTVMEDGETWVKVTIGTGKGKKAGYCMKAYLKEGV